MNNAGSRVTCWIYRRQVGTLQLYALPPIQRQADWPACLDTDAVDGEFAFQGNIVGQYTEFQELVALVERGDVELHTTRYDLSEINTVAEKLERHEIDGRAVITP